MFKYQGYVFKLLCIPSPHLSYHIARYTRVDKEMLNQMEQLQFPWTHGSDEKKCKCATQVLGPRRHEGSAEMH